MKSYKISYNIYAGIERLIEIIDGCANNPEIAQQQKLENIFLPDVQCQLYGLLMMQKTSILYIVGKII